MPTTTEAIVFFILLFAIIAIFATMVYAFKELSYVLVENVWLHDFLKKLIEKRMKCKIALNDYTVIKKDERDRDHVTYSCDHCGEDIGDDDDVHHLEYTIVSGKNDEKKAIKHIDLCDRCFRRITSRTETFTDTLMKGFE